MNATKTLVARRPLLLAVPFVLAALAACDKGAGEKQAPGSSAASEKAAAPKEVEILNVSYDPTRELYEDIDKSFSASYAAKTGTKVTVKQSHGGSSKQARAVIDGLEADVVTLALGYDIDAIQKTGLISEGWAKKLPHESVPFTSTIVFLVRAGNPKGIHDWADLVKPGVAVITPNPKTSGGARWNYLGAWGYAKKKPGGDDAKAREFVTKLYKNVPVLDSGARGATTTFVERSIGDVLIAWENEALLAKSKPGGEKFEVVTPSISIRADTPVAIVDKVVDKRGTREVAKAYLEYLYTPEAQTVAVKQFYRPTIAVPGSDSFAKIELFSIDDTFGGWSKANADHFADGANFDQIYQPSK